MKVAGLVLAAGSSRRLGQPKQLLPFRGRTLLDATLDVARVAPFAQRLVTMGGAAPDVQTKVDLAGFDVVDSVHHTEGCSSSIVSALAAIRRDIDGIVLLLGDQPLIDIAVIERLIASVSPKLDGSPTSGVGRASGFGDVAVCRYDNGIGHPFWFGRPVFEDLTKLHGDKAVWKLIESGKYSITEVRIDGDVPLDVDTWDDYERLLQSLGEAVEHTS